MSSIDKNGNIFEVDGNPDKASVMEELELKDIPAEDLSVVLNMTDKQRIKYFRNSTEAVS